MNAVILAVVVVVGLSGCGVGQITPGPDSQASPATIARAATITQQADIFTVSGPAGEEQAVRDVAEALKGQAAQVRRDLGYDYQSAVDVRLFADQESLDTDRRDAHNRGYYAYSVDNHIRMVTPRSPIPGLDIPYSARVGIAVHEFAHIVIGAINPDVPLWLNEGAAVYVGPHAVYTYVCEKRFPFQQIPDFSALEEAYGSIPAADLFAYSLVDYIASTHGLDSLKRLIRSPGEMETILGVSRETFENGWREYMEGHYGSQE